MLLLITDSVGRAIRIAVIDLISTANGKAVGAAAFERTDKQFGENFVKTLHDEALEPFWATTVSSLLAELSQKITPWLPEQIAIIPGKMLGEAWHWLITSHQSTHTNVASTTNGESKENGTPNIFAAFFETFVKKPSDLLLRLCGLGEDKGNFLWYSISQLGVFGLTSFSLRNDEEENLPGVNLDPNDSLIKNIGRGIGYTVVEQATYAISQVIRFSIDFKGEFEDNGGNVLAKSMVNVINERLFPGHTFLGISSAISTYSLGHIIPKTTAAAIGEFPMSILNRLLNCRNRRATKDKLDENGNKIPNYRFNDSKGFNKILDSCDFMFERSKERLYDLVTLMFRGEKSKEEFKKELIDSLNMNLSQAA